GRPARLHPRSSAPCRRRRHRPAPNDLQGHDMRLTEAFDRPDDGAHLAGLHARLAQRAEQDGVLDVSYCTVSSPLGELLLAATDVGLLRVAFDREGFDEVLAALAGQV